MSVAAIAALQALAPLFRYPDAAFPRHVDEARRVVPALEAFARETATLDRASLEITYTSTFDLAPSCSPHLGAHLFGDDSRARARLMLGLQQAIGTPASRSELQQSAGTPASRRLAGRRPRRPEGLGGEDAAGPAAGTAAFHELPDHIAEVLANASAFDENEWRELEELVLLPALAKMNEILAATENPYRHLVTATQSLLPPCPLRPEQSLPEPPLRPEQTLPEQPLPPAPCPLRPENGGAP